MRISGALSNTTTTRLVPGSMSLREDGSHPRTDSAGRKQDRVQTTSARWSRVPTVANVASGRVKRVQTYAANRARIISIMENFSLQAVIRVHDRNGALVFTVYPHSMTDSMKLFRSMKDQVHDVFPSMSFTKQTVVDDKNYPLQMFTVTISKSDLDTVYVSIFDMLRFRRFWMLCILIALLIYLLLLIW